MELIHKKCSNRVVLDISSNLKLVSPSFSINGKGVSPSVIEIVKGDSSKTSFYCNKCAEVIDEKTSERGELLVCCSICGHYSSTEECFHNEYFPAVCESCKTQLEKKDKSSYSDKLRRAHDLFEGLLNSDSKYIPLVKLLFQSR